MYTRWDGLAACFLACDLRLLSRALQKQSVQTRGRGKNLEQIGKRENDIGTYMQGEN